jgi:hypothetical protein
MSFNTLYQDTYNVDNPTAFHQEDNLYIQQPRNFTDTLENKPSARNQAKTTDKKSKQVKAPKFKRPQVSKPTSKRKARRAKTGG